MSGRPVFHQEPADSADEDDAEEDVLTHGGSSQSNRKKNIHFESEN